jgi:hypothetical protein
MELTQKRVYEILSTNKMVLELSKSIRAQKYFSEFARRSEKFNGCISLKQHWHNHGHKYELKTYSRMGKKELSLNVLCLWLWQNERANKNNDNKQFKKKLLPYLAQSAEP